MGHIVRPKKGHLTDTPENRALLIAVANDPSAWTERDQYGSIWLYREQEDGTEVWVQVYNGIIFNGGVNRKPTRAVEAKR